MPLRRLAPSSQPKAHRYKQLNFPTISNWLKGCSAGHIPAFTVLWDLEHLLSIAELGAATGTFLEQSSHLRIKHTKRCLPSYRLIAMWELRSAWLPPWWTGTSLVLIIWPLQGVARGRYPLMPPAGVGRWDPEDWGEITAQGKCLCGAGCCKLEALTALRSFSHGPFRS